MASGALFAISQCVCIWLTVRCTVSPLPPPLSPIFIPSMFVPPAVRRTEPRSGYPKCCFYLFCPVFPLFPGLMPLALSALFAISCEVYYSVPGCRAELIIGTVHTEIPGPCALFAISWVVVYYSVPGCRAELIIGTSQALDFAGRCTTFRLPWFSQCGLATESL